MLAKKLEKAFNEQLNAEMFSAYLYLSISAHFEAEGLPGFSNWMRLQAQEELMHAMKFYDHINEREGRVTLLPIGAPQLEWKSPLDAFEAAYQHEAKITRLIDDLMNLAVKEKDHASQIFLQWFVSEQVEELASTGAVIDKLRLIGDSSSGLFMMDRELGARQPGAEE